MKKIGIVLCLIILSACTSGNQNYEKAVSSGVTAVAKGQYQQATAFFKIAENEEDSAAINAYQEQLLYLENASEKSQRGDLTGARKDLQKLVDDYQLSRSFEQAHKKLSRELKEQEKTVSTIDEQLTDLATAIQEKKAATAKDKLLRLLKTDLSAGYLREQRLKLQQLQQNYFDLQQAELEEQQKNDSKTTVEKSETIIPEAIQDVWYNPLPNQETADYENPALKITNNTLYFYYNDQEYQITAVSQQDQTYTLYWDLNALVKRYGNQALGDNPLPFQVVLTEANERYPYKVLKMGNSTFYSEP